MDAKITTETKQYLRCPGCNDDAHSWGHLNIGQSFGPWYCDGCGLGIKGQATQDGASIETASDRKINTLVLLRLREPLASGEEIHIIVEGMTFVKDGDNPDFENDVYFYDEYTCPWNYLRLPLKAGDDTDPHGVFVHQETVQMPDDYDDLECFDSSDRWEVLFQSLRQ